MILEIVEILTYSFLGGLIIGLVAGLFNFIIIRN